MADIDSLDFEYYMKLKKKQQAELERASKAALIRGC